jgi:rhodanese-related sulfurtransferase
VDARSRAEWEKDGVQGSVLWNMDPREDANAMEAAAAARIFGAGLVVVYCGSEACGISRQIAEKIRKLDLGPQVKVLHGGWAAMKGGANLRGSSSSP